MLRVVVAVVLRRVSDCAAVVARIGHTVIVGIAPKIGVLWAAIASIAASILVVSALYIVTNLALTAVATWVQKRFVGEKKPLEVNVVGAPSTGGEA